MKRPGIRTLEDQVEPALARRFRVAQEALLSLRAARRASSYYSFEIHRAVDAGMFLSVIILCSSLLEIWLRDLLVIRKATQFSPKSKREFEWRISQIDREIEGDKRGMSFGDILKKLVALEVIDELECERLNQAFAKYRNPLTHGISGRFIGRSEPFDSNGGSEPTPEKMYLETIFSGVRGRNSKIEDKLDDEACDYLEEVVNFIAAHPMPNGV